MDKLERFVSENRERLDIYEPSSQVWERIEGKKFFISKRLLISLSAAAVLTLVLGTAMIIYSSSARKERLSGLSGEIREMEVFYNSTARTLYMEAKPLLTSQPEIEKELVNDLEQIDKICAEIKKDLRDNADNQEVIKALIQNYSMKISILEDMLRILNESENNKEKEKTNEL